MGAGSSRIEFWDDFSNQRSVKVKIVDHQTYLARSTSDKNIRLWKINNYLKTLSKNWTKLNLLTASHWMKEMNLLIFQSTTKFILDWVVSERVTKMLLVSSGTTAIRTLNLFSIPTQNSLSFTLASTSTKLSPWAYSKSWFQNTEKTGPEKCSKDSRITCQSYFLVQMFLYEMDQSCRFEQFESWQKFTGQIATLVRFQTVRICKIGSFRREKIWTKVA